MFFSAVSFEASFFCKNKKISSKRTVRLIKFCLLLGYHEVATCYKITHLTTHGNRQGRINKKEGITISLSNLRDGSAL